MTIEIPRPRTFEPSRRRILDYKDRLLTSIREESLRTAEAMEVLA